MFRIFLDENNNSIENLYKYIKETKILKETVDEYIRKMRITGIISLRGNGNFIDINTNENNKVEYVLNNYGDLIDIYEDNIISKYKYYNYISKVDKNLFTKTITNYTGLNIKKQKLLLDYAQKFNDSQLNYELKCCYTNKTSEDDVLKYIDKPTRLELLSAVCLVKYFDNINVIPNYSVDDEGLPTFTARGGVADIDCINENYYGLFEVTLMRSKALQTEHEIPSIKDHLENIDSNFSQKTFSYFVAPVITDRAELFINFINNCEINSNKCYGIKQLKIENVIEKFISCNRDFSKLI